VPSAADDARQAITFGPVPSRRLGRSLGINNVPPKTCSYACVYCQLGRTTRMQTERQDFYSPDAVCRQVMRRVEEAEEAAAPIDYLTFVPDGEPTLDIRLGESIDRLRPLGNRIAVICNASLLWRADVRRDLAAADWVSVKIDAVDETTWRNVDRPHKTLRLDQIQDGILEFAQGFGGRLVTETMIVNGVNDGETHVENVAAFVGRLRPAVAYVAAPIRPPAEAWVKLSSMDAMMNVYQSFAGHVDRVEFLMGYEGNEFVLSDSIQGTLLGITSVHPMREEAVDELLARAGEGWEVVRKMVARGRLVELDHEGHTFYVRKLPGR